jgi:hypothetical protein
VERRYPEAAERVLSDEMADALTHLGCRFVGEGHGKDGVIRYPSIQEQRDAVREYTRLA